MVSHCGCVRRGATRGTWLLLSALALLLNGCNDDRRPNVILITIDTLRADHVGVYGYAKPLTPSIDSFAAGATVFERAVAPAPHTIPSLLQIMASRYHQSLEIADEDVTLAETLRDNGYRTAAVIDNPLLEQDTNARGLMRGFGAFYRNGQLDHDPAQQHWKTKTPADAITAQAMRWFKKQDRTTPLFLWLHYFDPHDPYLPPFSDDMETLGHDLFSMFTGDIRNTFLFKEPHGDRARNMTEKQRSRLVDLYDAEVRYVDQSLGELFAFLRREGLYNNSLIILTADHGETFGEHGIWMHGFSLYQPEVHVPLILKYPYQRTGERVATPVQAIDVYPTIVEVAHLRAAGLGLDGTSLTQRASAPVFAFWGPWQLAQNDNWKLLREGNKVQLFRLDTDPAELHDLASAEPAVVSSLSAASAARLAAIHKTQPQLERASQETIERMRALGYLPE